MRLFVSTAILSAVAGMLAAAATPDRAIRAPIDGGHWKQARAALEPRMKANPSDAEAASLLSRVRSTYGDLDGALALAESAVRLEPKNAEYRWQLAAIVGSLAQKAGVLKQIGLGRRFRQEAEQAMALDPNVVKWEAGARMLNLHLAAKIQKLDAAEEDARRLLQIDAHRADPYTGLALVYATRGNLAELDTLLAEAEKAVPDNLGPFYQAGRVLLTTAGVDLSRADRYLRKYLTIEPESGQPGPAAAHWRLGQVLEKQGRKEEAIAAKKDLKRLKS